MKIHVLAVDEKAQSRLRKTFSLVERSRKHDLDVSIQDGLRAAPEGDLVYLDIRGRSSRSLAALAKKVRDWGVPVGVLDLEGQTEDAAAHFFAGFCDYIGPRTIKAGLSVDRFEQAAAFWREVSERAALERSTPEQRTSADERPGPTAPGSVGFSSWAEVADGSRITATLMYAGIAPHAGLGDRTSGVQQSTLVREFQQSLEKAFGVAGGRLWLWKGTSGLIALPYPGSCREALLSAIRYVLDYQIIRVETFSVPISPRYFRFAMHVGEVTYTESDTGTVVSDAVNSVFHIGDRATPDGGFVFTGSCAPSLPEELNDWFVEHGELEGHRIRRMRRLLS